MYTPLKLIRFVQLISVMKRNSQETVSNARAKKNSRATRSSFFLYDYPLVLA